MGFRDCGNSRERFEEYICEVCYDTVKEADTDLDEALRRHAEACERRQEIHLVEQTKGA